MSTTDMTRTARVPERDFVDTPRQAPDPAASLYVQSSSQTDADGAESHIVTGMRLVIGGPGDTAGLHRRYHHDASQGGEPDTPSARGRVRRLMLCADEIVVHGLLWLPECHLRIHARRLVFEDAPGDPGRLCTRPLPYAVTAAAEARDGVHGRTAGDLDLLVGEIDAGPAGGPVRFDLRGGDGQDAGAGRGGHAGTSVTGGFTSLNFRSQYLFDHCDLHHEFTGPIATYADLELRSGGMGGMHTHTSYGQNRVVPTSGENATPPGKPGNGGAGGRLLAAVDRPGLVDAAGGRAGAMALDVQGGRAGLPRDSAQYKLIVWDHALCGPLHLNTVQTTLHTQTVHGKDATAPAPDKPVGDVQPAQIDAGLAHAWAHPLAARAVLRYLRDAYLAAPAGMARWTDTIDAFEAALRAPPTAEAAARLSPFPGAPLAVESPGALQLEFASLSHRLRSGLDYFGHPAGWTPLYSLPLLLRLYEDELQRGLRLLVLTKWLRQRASRADEAGAIAGSTAAALRAEADAAIADIGTRTGSLRALRAEAESLQQRIDGYTVRLETERTRLENDAREHAMETAWIKLGVNTLSAVLQVIPYGQPALGTLASAAPGVVDTVMKGIEDGSVSPGAVASPIGSVLGSIAKASLDERAAGIVKAAQKDRDLQAEAAERQAKQLTDAGAAIGPALAGITGAIQGLSVPDSEVKARLAKLEAASPEFKTLARELATLNDEKSAFATRAADELQALAVACGTVNRNLGAIAAFERRQRDALRVLDHDLLLHLDTLDQSARHTLAKYLYYLAKSYEYALLEPCDADYRLDALFDKAADLAGDDVEGAAARAAGDLSALFRRELDRIRQSLIERYHVEYTLPLQMRISSAQRPQLMAALNGSGEVVVNLHEFNKVPADWQHVTIADIDIDFEFEPGAPLPADGTVSVSVAPQGDGTLRACSAEHDRLFAVRHPSTLSPDGAEPEGGLQWALSRHFAGGRRDVVRPSLQSVDLLNALAGADARALDAKIAAPSAWTDLRIRYRAFAKHRPPLASVLLTLHLNYREADPQHATIDVRSTGGQGVDIACEPADLNGRGDGTSGSGGAMLRIFRQGGRVRLQAPPAHGRSTFVGWDIVDLRTMARRSETQTLLELPDLNGDLRVYAQYRDAGQAMTKLAAALPPHTAGVLAEYLRTTPTPSHVERLRDDPVHAPFRARLPQMLARATAPSVPRTDAVLRQAPGGLAIGWVPFDADPTVLETVTAADGRRWCRVDVRGEVGWIEQPASTRLARAA